MADSVKHDNDVVINKAAGTDAIQEKTDERKPETSKKFSVENDVKNFVDAVKGKATEAFNFVAGGEGETKGLVGTVKEKAAGAYHYVAEKVTEATHVVTGDSHKEAVKASSQPTGTSGNMSAATDKTN